MSFQQALSGLSVAAQNLDVIGNNISNAGTVGFKEGVAHFADMYASAVSGSSGGASQVGLGTQLSGVSQEFSQGTINATSNSLDVAINGNGFFRMTDGLTTTYSRDGEFQLDNNNYLVNQQGLKLTGYPANGSGAISGAQPAPIQIPQGDLPPSATAKATVASNLSATATAPTATFNPNDPSTYNNSTSVTVYDSLGTQHVMTLYFVKSATANQYDVYGACTQGDASTGIQPAAAGATTSATYSPLTTLAFSAGGALDTSGTVAGSYTAPTTVTVGSSTGSGPVTLTLNLDSTTQYGSTFGVNQSTQDGYGSGQLTGFNISDDGKIAGNYSNGQTRNLGQIVLANFADPQGLVSTGKNQYLETAASGQPVIGAPGSGSLGNLQSSALEQSNVDLTSELVNLIKAQQAYQANAQSIKSQDQIMTTIESLK